MERKLRLLKLLSMLGQKVKDHKYWGFNKVKEQLLLAQSEGASKSINSYEAQSVI